MAQTQVPLSPNPDFKDQLPELFALFSEDKYHIQDNADGQLTLWVAADTIVSVLSLLKGLEKPFSMLFDLHGVDERLRLDRGSLPCNDFTVVYQLMSVERNQDIRLKVALDKDNLHIPTVTHLWPNANWYEREAWDLFGIVFDGHPNLRRILLPPTFTGHPLRKEFPCRATEKDPFSMDEQKLQREQNALRFVPEEWGMSTSTADNDYMFLNLGPNHPSVHGVFRVALQLDGERVVNSVPDIGYHHRGAEKIAERQTWHGFIPLYRSHRLFGRCDE